jgi:hypothetical protein
MAWSDSFIDFDFSSSFSSYIVCLDSSFDSSWFEGSGNGGKGFGIIG